MLRDLNASKHWRDRAAKMRALAEKMANPRAVQLMNDLADDFDKLADRAEEGIKRSAYLRAEIIKRRAAGETLVSIAKSYGVNRSTIERLLKQAQSRRGQERRSTELRSP